MMSTAVIVCRLSSSYGKHLPGCRSLPLCVTMHIDYIALTGIGNGVFFALHSALARKSELITSCVLHLELAVRVLTHAVAAECR